jgi:putative membrane protein
MNTTYSTALLAMDHWHDHDGRWFPIFPLIFIAIWLVVILTFRRRWHHASRQSGQSVLAERYARGEIDEVEYRTRREVLRGDK